MAVALAGAGLIGFLWSDLMRSDRDDLFVIRLGIPGVLLLAAVGAVAFVFGIHRLIARRYAGRRWTPHPLRKT